MSTPATLVFSLSRLSSARFEGSRVIVAVWDSGLVVWDASYGCKTNAEYACAQVEESVASLLSKSVDALAVLHEQNASYTVPSSSYWQISLRQLDGKLKRVAWDERMSSQPSHVRDKGSFTEAWVSAMALANAVRPRCGAALEEDLQAHDTFRSTFPGF